MTFVQKLKAGMDIDTTLHATFGPNSGKGFPVRLDLWVGLSYSDKKDGWCLAMMCDIRVKKSKKLGLVPVSMEDVGLDFAVRHLDRCGLACPTLSSIVPIWAKWDMNEMCVGTKRQEAFVNSFLRKHPDRNFSTEQIFNELKKHGLFEDKSYLVDGRPYEYGSDFLFRKIPDGTLLRLCKLCDKGLKICRKEDRAVELAKAVLDWAAYDDQVAIDGWTGGIDEKWDNTRTRMVSIAQEIAGKSKGEKNAGC